MREYLFSYGPDVPLRAAELQMLERVAKQRWLHVVTYPGPTGPWWSFAGTDDGLTDWRIVERETRAALEKEPEFQALCARTKWTP